MKRVRLMTAVVVVVVGLGAGLWWVWSAGPPLPAPQIVTIPAGAGRGDVARQLEQAGVVRSAVGFELWCWLHPRGGLKAGVYRFDGGESVPAVYRTLNRGRFYTLAVIVPEGYNRFDIARELDRLQLATADAFLAASADPTSIRDLDPAAVSLEGYLFPATYRIMPTTPVDQIVHMMTHRFRQEVQRDHPAPGTLHQWVTLASLIEKETAVAAERPLIAGVFTNRLQRGLELQCDPTVIYAALLAHAYTGSLHRLDLDRPSPYNTYRQPGLPPGPIANPGHAALEAAAHPAPTRFMYFVSNGAGAHRFAVTLAQQQRNVALYLAERKHGGG
ncbi:MAG TPA: endolytic transglycosylase MltG [Terriglobales bacterium]